MDDLELQAGFFIHLLQLLDHAVDEAVNVVAGDIEHVIMEALCRRIDRSVFIVPQAELLGSGIIDGATLHRHDGGTGMSGGLNLGDDTHTMGPSIFQEINELGTREIAVSTLGLVIGVAVARDGLSHEILLIKGTTAARSHLRQLGEARNFKSPTFIIGEVELQGIELIIGHQVDESVQILTLSHIIARDVKHQTSVTEVGPVNDKAILQAVALAMVQGGDESQHAVDQGGLSSAQDGDFAVMDTQAVILAVVAHLLVQQQTDNSALATGGIDAALLQLTGKQVLGTTITAPLEPLARLDGHEAAHLGKAVLDVHLLGHREDVVVVARVAVTEAVDGLVETVHVVAVGINLVVAPLTRLVECSAVDIHDDGVSHVAVQYQVAAFGHVIPVEQLTARQHLDHERVAGSDRLVVGIRLDAVIAV